MLDLFIVNGRADDKAVAIGKRGGHIAIQDLDIDAELKALALLGEKVAAVAEGRDRPTVAEVRDVGERLFRRIFRDDMLLLYNGLPAGDQVSIQIVSNAADVHRIPWEYLAPHDCQPPHPHRCVVRIHQAPTGAPLRALTRRKSLRVLLAVAEPPDEASTGWQEVKRDLDTLFANTLGPTVRLNIIKAATAQDIADALAARQYDVFHFLGHGRLVRGVGHVVLFDVDRKQSTDLSGDDLASILQGKGLQLCILSACKSATGQAANDFYGVAGKLLAHDVPAVVGSQTVIPTSSVAPFVRALYANLLETGNIDQAVMAGRAILFAALRTVVKANLAVVEWGIPTLIRRPGAGQLFLARRVA
jgi:hypothetical protein